MTESIDQTVARLTPSIEDYAYACVQLKAHPNDDVYLAQVVERRREAYKAALRTELSAPAVQGEPQVCCDNPSQCLRPCTPRGEWLARQPSAQDDELTQARIRCGAIAKPAAQAEPVAWRTGSLDRGWKTTYMKRVVEIWEEQGCKVEPLYTTPPSPSIGREVTDAGGELAQKVMGLCRLFLDSPTGKYDARLTFAQIFQVAATPDAKGAEWLPLTQELIDKISQEDRNLYWLCTANGTVYQGQYEWRQGRYPDRFHGDIGDVHVSEVTHIMLFRKPSAPFSQKSIAAIASTKPSEDKP